MVAFLLPRRSTLHRIAAIALFRALLTQSKAVWLAEKQSQQLQNVIRNRFKQLRHMDSVRHLRLLFQAGYEAIDHLDAAAAGSESSQSYICTLLEQAPESTKRRPPRPKHSKNKNKSRKETEKDENYLKRVRPSILDRPRPLDHFFGRRHVPRLFSANGIPVLRVKKPQPKNLSGYIADRIKRRGRLHDTRHRLVEESATAAFEDQWDSMMRRLGVGKSEGQIATAKPEPSWQAPVDSAAHEVQMKLNEDTYKDQKMAHEMLAVVDKERALYEKEKAERTQERERRHLQRQEEDEKSREGNL